MHIYITRYIGTSTVPELRTLKVAQSRNSYLVQQFRNCAGLLSVMERVCMAIVRHVRVCHVQVHHVNVHHALSIMHVSVMHMSTILDLLSM